jgi:heme A synthase
MRTNANAGIGGLILGLTFYIPLFWRTFKSNSGNKLIEAGCFAAGFFVLLASANAIPGFPIWLAVCFGTLALLSAFATLLFAAQRAYNAIRGRKTD